ncbi:class I SAM-dependent DNA methyltransferase [Vagococcus fluvialis]|uniref:class I SAM-dependent DNA methyltransferase n=1 Tax=Vagococcus fluvialis TaxID=2738 RepID=UPI001D09B3B6|nr:DNA methyltransferase [Vagococcus fluvialis]UDM80950.1 N-6 DNA methylase [Vagococcus fluvialis]
MAKIKKLNITEIEDKLKKVIKNINKETFIDELLYLYEIPKTSITRAKKNLVDGKDFIIKNRLFYREVSDDVVLAIDAIEQEILGEKSLPRYIITTDFNQFAAVDTKTRETLNISIEELPANADFFLAWNGIEKADYQAESPADRKAAERFAKLYDVVARDNPNANEHTFNLFLIRTLFLLFAEDTGIIEKGLFTNVLKTRTDEEGNNFNVVIKELFEILDISPQNRKNTPEWLIQFPYVNGKLFGEPHADLVFSKKSRELLIEAGELLNWNEINPDILGAMIQSVASEEDRHVSGMHYTSVSNIMKVINPLFLEELVICFNDLEERFEENKIKNITEKTRNENDKLILKNLYHLLDRISKIKFLDPACGSGNFLIIVYKEIRRLEIEILVLIQNIENMDLIPISRVSLDQFSGIELDDFAHEVARLSLWIAEHQMNEEMVAKIPSVNVALLPLKDAGNIVNGDALKIDWNTVVPYDKSDEVYVIGNPPYIGAKKQNPKQKEDLKKALDDNKQYKKIDYIAAWFYLGAKYISDSLTAKLAFVTTNSISQGEQVSMIWPNVFNYGQIIFAYTSFKWSNSAKNNAGVTVSIIGLSSKNNKDKKFLYTSDGKKEVENIAPYLTEGENIIVSTKNISISGFPKAYLGCLSLDGGNFILSNSEFKEVSNEYPQIIPYIKKYVGTTELINQSIRYTLWLNKNDYKLINNNEFVQKRVEAVREVRKNGGQSAKGAVDTSYEFFTKKQREQAIESHHNKNNSEMLTIVIPRHSSENREYVPMGFVGEDTVVSDSATAVYNAPTWLLALLESRMHMTWLRAIGGKLETRYRYSTGLVYNTFPIKNISTQRKNEMSRVMLEILDIRELEGGTLAELYSRKTMPDILRKKHAELDGIVDRAYRQKPFEGDEERLSVLLKLYQEMTNE